MALSGEEPAFRNMSLKDDPDPALFPNALETPLNALKALLDINFELLGVVLSPAVGVGGEPNAGCPNADTGFGAVPIELVWPNTEPGVAGTGIFGAGGCPPPNALIVWVTGFGFANGESLALKFDSPWPVLILRPAKALETGGGPAGVVLAGREVVLATVGGDVGGVASSATDGLDVLEGVAVAKGDVDGVVLANDETAFSSDVVAGGEKAGVVLAAGSAEVKRDFNGVVVDPSGDAEAVPKTVDPVPPPNVASPLVFQAGMVVGVVDAAWPNADTPPEANAPNPPPPLVAEAPGFVSAGFEPLNVAVPPDANAPNGPPLPKVEGDVVLTGVTMGVVDMGVPSPVLPNPD